VTSGYAGQAAGRAWKNEYSMVMKRKTSSLHAKKKPKRTKFKQAKTGQYDTFCLRKEF